MRRRTGLLLAALMVAPLAGCGSGSSTSASGAPIVNWYIGSEGWLPAVIKACNAKAGGAYELKSASLPTNPDSQREQLVRRLAAKDDSIDLIGMDVSNTELKHVPFLPLLFVRCTANVSIDEHAWTASRLR